MLIKLADDKSERLALLQDLQKSSLLDARQKEWLRIELRNLTASIKGECEAAFHFDGHYKDGQNNVLLHDLRFQIDGEVAQIDHLVINRTGYMVLIETKNHSGDLEVNAHGEFTVRYGKDRYGIPSPYEQSRRHARILGKLLERLEIGTRTDKLPEFHNVVMMHPQAITQRPDTKVFDTSFLAAHQGQLQLPDFQRSWVWDDDRIKSLIASVSCGFSVGALMTLKTQAVGTKKFAHRLGRVNNRLL